MTTATENTKSGYTNAELEGTYLAMVEVSLPGTAVELLRQLVAAEDLNQDADVNSGTTFETRLHLTLHMKLRSLPSSQMVEQMRKLGKLELCLDGLHVFETRDKLFPDTSAPAKKHSYDV